MRLIPKPAAAGEVLEAVMVVVVYSIHSNLADKSLPFLHFKIRLYSISQANHFFLFLNSYRIELVVAGEGLSIVSEC